MGDLVLGGLDVVGEDDVEGSMVLGAGARRAVRVPTPRWMRGATSQGVSRPNEELDYLPFEPATLTAGNTSIRLLARPQRPFRGERLVASAFDVVTGADVSFRIAISPALFVGAVQIGSAQGAVPLSTFAATAFGVRLSMPASGQGTDYSLFLLAFAPFVNDVAITAAIIGRAVR